MADLIVLPRDWYVYTVAIGVDPQLPGIYEWQIEGVGSYIGKYGRIVRPTREYGRNVVRLLNGRKYRKGKPDGFRRVHRELARAHCEDRRIELIIRENVDPSRINKRESELIALHGSLNDPPFGRRSEIAPQPLNC